MFGFQFFRFDIYKFKGDLQFNQKWRPTIDPKETEKKQRLSYQRLTGTYKPY
jgi:hypothetical protein